MKPDRFDRLIQLLDLGFTPLQAGKIMHMCAKQTAVIDEARKYYTLDEIRDLYVYQRYYIYPINKLINLAEKFIQDDINIYMQVFIYKLRLRRVHNLRYLRQTLKRPLMRSDLMKCKWAAHFEERWKNGDIPPYQKMEIDELDLSKDISELSQKEIGDLSSVIFTRDKTATSKTYNKIVSRSAQLINHDDIKLDKDKQGVDAINLFDENSNYIKPLGNDPYVNPKSDMFHKLPIHVQISSLQKSISAQKEQEKKEQELVEREHFNESLGVPSFQMNYPEKPERTIQEVLYEMPCLRSEPDRSYSKKPRNPLDRPSKDAYNRQSVVSANISFTTNRKLTLTNNTQAHDAVQEMINKAKAARGEVDLGAQDSDVNAGVEQASALDARAKAIQEIDDLSELIISGCKGIKKDENKETDDAQAQATAQGSAPGEKS